MIPDSKMVDIIRRIGEATPSPIKLSKLLQSPEQDFFSFSVAIGNWTIATKIFELLAQSSVNIRFIVIHAGKNEDARVQLCVDTKFQREALNIFQTEEIAEAIQEFHHHDSAIILSLYPFNGQPQVAERIFTILRLLGIEILGANTATSVFSCVISESDLDPVVTSLKEVFVLQ
jgi:aspartokinase